MLAQTRRGGPDGSDGVAGVAGGAGAGSEYYRLRSFSITPSGIFNLGDSFRSRRSRSNGSVASTTSSNSDDLRDLRERLPSGASASSVEVGVGEGEARVPSFKVGMLGAAGVGKTTLTYQFTTSEYICAYDTSLDEEFGQKTVSVLLDGRESDLEIVDHPAAEMSAEAFCATYNPDVFVVVYSVVDRRSFQIAEDILTFLWKSDYMITRGVILVGNKADLERKREVPMSAGRRLANSCNCKFIETSSGLDHNVDELLVGLLAQVQLNPRREALSRSRRRRGHRPSGPPSAPPPPRSAPPRPSSAAAGRRLIRQLLGIKRKARSCENLLVL